METLPLEVLEKICTLLTVEELSSCCAVSSDWRDIFDQDLLWKPRCRQNLEEYLRTTPSTVNPTFISPETENSSLSSIGRWRLAYMRETHLWNNWRTGNYNKQQVEQRHCGSDELVWNNVVVDSRIEARNAPHFDEDPDSTLMQLYSCTEPYSLPLNGWDLGVVILKEHYLLRLHGDKVLILDMRENIQFPVFQTTHYLPDWRLGGPTCIELEDLGIFIFNYDTVVQVFKLDEETKSIRLTHLFQVNEAEKLLEVTADIAKDMYNNTHYCTICVKGGILFGSVLLENQLSTLHVWDVEHGEKLKEDVCPGHGIRIHSVKKFCQSEDILVHCILHHDDVFYIYSPKLLAFRPYKSAKFSEASAGLHKKCIWLSSHSDDKFIIQNYMTSKILFDRTVKAAGFAESDNAILVADRDKNIFIFNTNTFQLGCLYMCNFVAMGFLCGNFIWVQEYDYDRGYQASVYEVGSRSVLKKSTLSLTKYNDKRIIKNSACTRIIVDEKWDGTFLLTEMCFW